MNKQVSEAIKRRVLQQMIERFSEQPIKAAAKQVTNIFLSSSRSLIISSLDRGRPMMCEWNKITEKPDLSSPAKLFETHVDRAIVNHAGI